MIKFTFLLSLILLQISSQDTSFNITDFIDNISLDRGFIKSSIEAQILEQSEKNLPYIPEKKDSLPIEWDWSKIDGKNYLTNVINQDLPQPCASSWVQAVTSSLQDRIKIMRNAHWPDIYLSQQVLLSCITDELGCKGGDDLVVYSYIQTQPIPDFTCSVYQAKDHLQGLTCTKDLLCKWHHYDTPYTVEDYNTYSISEFGQVKGEENMMNEIKNRGPITCSIENTKNLEQYTGGIFEDEEFQTENYQPNHVVSIVGWGEIDGIPFWNVRNSLGTHWGEQGFFRIIRGKNNLGIESRCHYGVPEDSWSDRINDVKENKHLILKSPYLDDTDIREFNLQPQRDSTSDLPEEWDWRDVNGTNYITRIQQQLLPIYCGSCWAQVATSLISDRINIMRNNTFPQITLSPQAVVNCNQGGSCYGGSTWQSFAFGMSEGYFDETCQPYTAFNNYGQSCNETQKCQNCYQMKDGSQECFPQSYLKDYKTYKVNGRGFLERNNVEAMKREIKNRGPIVCAIVLSEQFNKYKGGIIHDNTYKKYFDHIISLIGWGVQDGHEYFIGKNSFGTQWGEEGFFKISSDPHNNLRLLEDCGWAQPEEIEEYEYKNSYNATSQQWEEQKTLSAKNSNYTENKGSLIFYSMILYTLLTLFYIL